jgi:hypothetical protein
MSSAGHTIPICQKGNLRRGGRTRQRPRLRRGGAVYTPSSFRRSSSDSLATLAAMRRASSRVSRLAAAPSRLLLEIDVGERLPVGVANDEALWVLVDHPRRREAARGRHGAM